MRQAENDFGTKKSKCDTPKSEYAKMKKCDTLENQPEIRLFGCFFRLFCAFSMVSLGNRNMALKKANATGRKRNTGVMISKCDRGACVAFGVAPQ